MQLKGETVRNFLDSDEIRQELDKAIHYFYDQNLRMFKLSSIDKEDFKQTVYLHLLEINPEHEDKIKSFIMLRAYWFMIKLWDKYKKRYVKFYKNKLKCPFCENLIEQSDTKCDNCKSELIDFDKNSMNYDKQINNKSGKHYYNDDDWVVSEHDSPEQPKDIKLLIDKDYEKYTIDTIYKLLEHKQADVVVFKVFHERSFSEIATFLKGKYNKVISKQGVKYIYDKGIEKIKKNSKLFFTNQ